VDNPKFWEGKVKRDRRLKKRNDVIPVKKNLEGFHTFEGGRFGIWDDRKPKLQANKRRGVNLEKENQS